MDELMKKLNAGRVDFQVQYGESRDMVAVNIQRDERTGQFPLANVNVILEAQGKLSRIELENRSKTLIVWFSIYKKTPEKK